MKTFTGGDDDDDDDDGGTAAPPLMKINESEAGDCLELGAGIGGGLRVGCPFDSPRVKR
ncbi:GL11288 [Drosophila persimilis]|uniref:GL11288 n=1 Tax=Drosophila persimilis TaxID=7234 RepID=B4GA09_DROPE|nr:GL11288 [Drosophila persimilis]